MIGTRTMTVFFPFIIIDLYWKDNPRGRLGWFLPVSLHLVSVNAIVQVALMVREGLSNKEIGDRLFISPLTVRDHVSRIYRKFGVKRRAAFLAKLK